MKALQQLLLIVAVLIATKLGQTYLAEHAPEVPTKAFVPHVPLVEVITAHQAEHTLTVQAEGTVNAASRLNLSPEIPGRVLQINPGFDEGLYLEAGALLLEIDPADYRLAVDAAQANLRSAKAGLALEKSMATAAVADWHELNQGKAPDLVARTAQIAVAKAQIASAKVAVAQAKLMLTRTTIRMPFDGRIVTKNVELGQRVDPAMALAVIEATGDLEVRITLELADLGLLNLGANGGGAAGISIALEAEIGGEQRRWSATGMRTAADLSPLNPTLTLIAKVESNQQAPPPGLFVHAKLTGKRVRAFSLPRRALGVDQRIMVVDQERRLSYRTIRVLQTTRDTVLITDGLNEGDQVVITPPPVVLDNMLVRLPADEQATPAGL